MCSYTKASKWVLIKGLQYLSQDQEVVNELKTSKNLINTPLQRKLKKEGKGRKQMKNKEKYS
jgi:hypothetical protein